MLTVIYSCVPTASAFANFEHSNESKDAAPATTIRGCCRKIDFHILIEVMMELMIEVSARRAFSNERLLKGEASNAQASKGVASKGEAPEEALGEAPGQAPGEAF